MFLYRKIQTSLKLTTQKCSKPTLKCLASFNVRTSLLNFTKIHSMIIETQQMTNMWHFHRSLISRPLQWPQHAWNVQSNMSITIVSTQENAQLLTTKLPSSWKLSIKVCLNDFPWLIQFLNIKNYKATKLCNVNCLSRYLQQYRTQKIMNKSSHQKPWSSYQQVSIHKLQLCSKSHFHLECVISWAFTSTTIKWGP
jgi:hypothetical protein